MNRPPVDDQKIKLAMFSSPYRKSKHTNYLISVLPHSFIQLTFHKTDRGEVGGEVKSHNFRSEQYLHKQTYNHAMTVND